MVLSLLPNGVMEDFCCITDTVERCTFLYRSFSTALTPLVKPGMAGQLQIGERNDLQH